MLGDRFFTEPARELLFARTLNGSSPVFRNGWLVVSLSVPIKVTFPESLVLEFTHVSTFAGGGANNRSEVWHTPTPEPRHLCVSSTSWTSETLYPYTVTSSALPIQLTVPVINFTVSAPLDSEHTQLQAACGSPPSFSPYTSDLIWRALTRSSCDRKDVPSCRMGTSIVYYQRHVVVFGGFTDDNEAMVGVLSSFASSATTAVSPFHNDVWVYSLDTLKWSLVLASNCAASAVRPSCRAYHTGTRVGDDVFIVGGSTSNGLLVDNNDLVWRLSLPQLLVAVRTGMSPTADVTARALWTNVPNSQRVRGVFGHAAAWDGASGLFVMGGTNGKGHCG